MLRKQYKVVDYYFTVNGYTAWVGLALAKFSLVDKTIYWVCDYYPQNHKNKVIAIMRWLYWQFEKQNYRSDRLAFHNNRLIEKWKKKDVQVDSKKRVLVPIGTSKEMIRRKKRGELSICFLGVLKRSQGVDFIIDSANQIAGLFPNTSIHIIGPGPDTAYFQNKAQSKTAKVIFHGYVDDSTLDALIGNCHIGLALYVPDPSYVSYYGDPGKIKKYISHGLPVIATNIHEFNQQLEVTKAGVLVSYGNKKELVNAIKSIVQNYKQYQSNVMKLRNQYNYKKLYTKMFEL